MKLELLELASSGAESDPHKFGRVLAGVVQESLREARAPGGMAEAVSETQMQACASCLSHNKTRDIWRGDAGHHGHLRQLAFSSRAGGQNLLECTSAVSFVKRCSLQDDCDARLEDLEKQLEQLMEEELVLESETQPAVELQGQGGERQLREAKQQEEERKQKEADEEAQRMKERLEAERLALHKKEEEAKKKQERQEAERLALHKKEEEAKKKQEREEAERLALLKQEEAKKKQEREEAERLALRKQQEEAKKKQEREEAERLALLQQQEEAKKKREAEEEKERLRREEAIKEQERDDMEWLANQEREEEEERKKGAEAEAEQDQRAASESPMKMAQDLQAPRDDDCAGQNMEEMKAAVESARQEARRKEEELLQLKAKLASKGAPTTASAERKQLLQQLQQKREALLKQQLEARKARADRATAAKAPPAKAPENQQEAFAAELAKAFGWGTAATESEEKPVPAADLQATSVQQQQQPKAQLQEADAPAWIHPELPSRGDVEQTKAAEGEVYSRRSGANLLKRLLDNPNRLNKLPIDLQTMMKDPSKKSDVISLLCDHRGNLEQVNLMFQMRSKQATKNKQQATMTPLTELEVKQKYGEQAERVMQQKRTQGLVVEDPNLQGVSLTSIFVHVCPSFIHV